MSRRIGIEQAARSVAEQPSQPVLEPGGPASRADRRARGQALTEFALLAPAFLLLILLAVDFGRLFFTYIAVHNAAREATFYAAVNAADSGYAQASFDAGAAAAAVREANVQGQGGEGSLQVGIPTCYNPVTTATMACNVASGFAPGIGNHVRVSVQQPFTFITPLIGNLFGGQLVLTASSTAPVLNPLEAGILPGPSISPAPTPTPTPTPIPTPTPTPTATPTLPPGATPAPTPTPTPTPVPTPRTCVVPNFVGGYWENVGGYPATTVWQNAGFTGTLIDRVQKKQIERQELTANSTVLCSSTMWVDKN